MTGLSGGSGTSGRVPGTRVSGKVCGPGWACAGKAAANATMAQSNEWRMVGVMPSSLLGRDTAVSGSTPASLPA
ncbi:MAG: hypothetical protein K2R98_02825 [Gemmataceae bacterium]|nr:hypothetical protein [Gemmataceae bacterium]